MTAARAAPDDVVLSGSRPTRRGTAAACAALSASFVAACGGKGPAPLDPELSETSTDGLSYPKGPYGSDVDGVIADVELQGWRVSLYNPRRSAPFMVLIDRQGHIVKVREGYVPGDADQITEEIRRLLTPS